MSDQPFKPSSEKVKSPSREGVLALVNAIGGADRLNLILEDFYQRMHDDIIIGFFFTGKDIKHIAHQQAKFILSAAGLIDRFDGKGPSTAHVALPPILTGHFDRRLVILNETLKAHQLPLTVINDWMAFEESFRAMVVSG